MSCRGCSIYEIVGQDETLQEPLASRTVFRRILHLESGVQIYFQCQLKQELKQGDMTKLPYHQCLLCKLDARLEDEDKSFTQLMYRGVLLLKSMDCIPANRKDVLYHDLKLLMVGLSANCEMTPSHVYSFCSQACCGAFQEKVLTAYAGALRSYYKECVDEALKALPGKFQILERQRAFAFSYRSHLEDAQEEESRV